MGSAEAAFTVTPISFQPEVLAGNADVAYGTPTTSLMRWTPDGGAVEVASFASMGVGSTSVVVDSCTADGSIVAGRYRLTTDFQTWHPFTWSTSGGLQTFTSAPGTINGRAIISGDGQTVVSENFRLLPGPVTPLSYSPHSINQDGGIIGVTSTGGLAKRLVSGVEQAAQVPADTSLVRVSTMTSDGSVAAGFTSFVPFVWSEGQVEVISSPYFWQPHDISADGRIIVGSNPNIADTATIVIDGQRLLVKDFLAANAASTSITRFDTARGISNDGLRFVIGGLDSNSVAQGALITIPEPGTSILLAVAAPCLLRRRVRK